MKVPNDTVLRYPSLAKRRTYCLHPEKLAFPSERAAFRALRRLMQRHPEATAQEPYRCACGKWHLTTKREDG